MEKRRVADDAAEQGEGWFLVSPPVSSVLLHIISWIIGPAQTDSPSGAVKVPDVKQNESCLFLSRVCVRVKHSVIEHVKNCLVLSNCLMQWKALPV